MIIHKHVPMVIVIHNNPPDYLFPLLVSTPHFRIKVRAATGFQGLQLDADHLAPWTLALVSRCHPTRKRICSQGMLDPLSLMVTVCHSFWTLSRNLRAVSSLRLSRFASFWCFSRSQIFRRIPIPTGKNVCFWWLMRALKWLHSSRASSGDEHITKPYDFMV